MDFVLVMDQIQLNFVVPFVCIDVGGVGFDRILHVCLKSSCVVLLDVWPRFAFGIGHALVGVVHVLIDVVHVWILVMRCRVLICLTWALLLDFGIIVAEKTPISPDVCVKLGGKTSAFWFLWYVFRVTRKYKT